MTESSGSSGLRDGEAEKSRYGVSLAPSERTLSDHHGHTLKKPTAAAITIEAGPVGGMTKKEVQPLRNRLYLPAQVVVHTVRFLVDTGSGVSLLATRVWNVGHDQKESCGGTGASCAPSKDEH